MKNNIKPGAVFAIHHGDHKGKFAVCIKPEKKKFEFLFLPGLEPYSIPTKDVRAGFSNRVIEFVEVLPPDIFKLCEAQYAKINK